MAENDRPGKIPPKKLENLKRELFGIDGAAPTTGGRFKPGQSGNPKGRPRRKEDTAPPDLLPFQSLLLEALQKPVSIREGSQVSSISSKEAILRSLVTSAMKGSAHAQKIVLEWLHLTERGEAAALAHEHDVFGHYCAHWREVMAEAECKGEPLPQPLPHPDDVVIEPGKRVRFVGPCDAEQAVEYEARCRFRDILIMQHALDEKLMGEDAPRGAMLAAWVLNMGLPLRMRLCETTILLRVMQHEASSKRKLLKLVHQAWRAIGIDKPRGWVFPPQVAVQKRLELTADLIAGMTKGNLDAAAMGRGEFNEAALELMEKHGIAAA